MIAANQSRYSRIILAAAWWLPVPLFLLAAFGGDYRWIGIGGIIASLLAMMPLRCSVCGRSLFVRRHFPSWRGVIRCDGERRPDGATFPGDLTRRQTIKDTNT